VRRIETKPGAVEVQLKQKSSLIKSTLAVCELYHSGWLECRTGLQGLLKVAV